ncbi:putative major facilitator superfamily transporter [Ilumatobacter coccineus YM16-304]|uniref:Putative major facilitator superfamily transporter n=1 Tax=Ilumatobacter coccineus (strain NBRC 103263 / KCTC 29153 / YM16-304) TaxID=1313172 RepID=A0A6C7ECI2_ILUCY|nr:putative major facilitator superfamily transporter [Ilumatobacter coccineus YM16-304]
MVSGDVRRLAAGLFAVAWGTNVSTPLILRYQDRLDLSNSEAVAIFCVYVVGILLALLFAGRLSDRFGRRPLVLPSTVLSAAGSLVLIGGQDSFATLLAGRFLLGAVSGAMLSVGTAWLNEVAATSFASMGGTDGETAAAMRDRRLRLATMTTVVIYVGFGFGPITSALWDRFVGGALVWPYVIHAAACVAAIALMWPVPETKPGDPGVALRPRLGIPVPARPEFFGVLAPAAIWVFGFPSVSFALFPVILRDAIDGSEVLLAGANGTLTAVVVLLARPIVERVGDPRRAIPVALVMGIVGYGIGIVSFTTGAWWLVPGAAILLGSASGVLMGSGLAITEEIADESNRGSLSATFYLAAYSGMSMPLVITGLGNLTSTTTALCTVTGVCVVATAVVTANLRLGRRPGSEAAVTG